MMPIAVRLAAPLMLLGAVASPLQAQAAPTPSPRPFTVSSVGSGYPFAVELHGTYRVFADSVVIDVAGGEAVNQVPPQLADRGKAKAITIAASLGKGTVESWTSEGDTPPVKVGAEFRPGERIPVKAIRFVIRGTDTLRLRDRWLAFELGVQQRLGVEGIEPGPLFSYACTEEFVLGPTPESEMRAQAQRKRYSTVC